ncbi:DNA/RNA non-specific endonuclease [Hyalangium rubrum]|uniref:DNA/RNA non-specific endonuclease n=1 Tax=Hyalangium rubrum TaxID=3103134 RepID=A0ABU5HDS1_9BACT|nr:DNA/RNA non-specific endonuclease [Hyalangium sp. s54d21]MDY7231420.1 DNA/RNA non-specific endonuclease [Hyalangium sp. s54d21]
MAIRPTGPSPALIPSVKVGNTVASEQGSWNRSSAREAPIAQLQQKFGWAEGGWQAELLKAADAAGSTASRRGNGNVSAAEVDAYLAKPEDARFLTSTAVQQQRTALEQKLSGGARSVAVDGFDSDWQDAVARRADQLSGDANGQLSRAELDSFLNDMKAGRIQDTRWVPDQQTAMFESKVAETAGELDPLRPDGPTSGLSLVKEYMRLSADQPKNVPTFVSYLLSASDIQETPVDVDRDRSNFTRDPELGSDSVTASDYTGTEMDRGHMKPAEDSPTQEAMDESHLMSNIAPQHPNLNRQAWRTLEDAVNDLVRSSGGKAHILTGNLFLDAQGKPLPPEAVDTLGANARRVAVPTHQFKTVLLELPNGHLSMFAYMVPNVKDAPTKKEDITPFLANARTSVDHIEELLGQDLYAQLPKSVQARLETDSTAEVSFREASLYEAASLLWPQQRTP